MAESPLDIDALDIAALKALILELLEQGAVRDGENAALREDIRRLKGLKGPPDIKPSGMNKKARSRAKAGRAANKRRRGKKKDRVVIDEKRVVTADAPAGSRFKGYEDYLVQDLICRPHSVLLRRERWLMPDGSYVVAPLPAGTRGHFGPELRRFILAHYHGLQTSVERLVTLLADLGVDISKRQIMRLLNDGQEGFVAENNAVLHAGLESAPWVSVDDTGARHRDRNGVTTQIGNDAFAWFGTSFSKSRLNFLSLLRAGHKDYVLNEAVFSYMAKLNLSGVVIALLAGAPKQHFADEAAWQAELHRLGIADLKVHPDPLRVASEGALWGALSHHGLLADTVILSDDAGQFNIGTHALCWVHAERLIHKLDTFTDHQRREKERIQARLWWFYADLKEYRKMPTRLRARQLARRFDALFTSKTGFVTLDRLLARLHAKRDHLLVVLDHPHVPLNTNGSENDIRAMVTRRKLSGGTKSETGRQARDTFIGLIKTCRKLGISYWNYLGDRLKVPGATAVPYLPGLVRQRCLEMA
ncbi:MAG: transposase [Hyphomicrobiales bacterium]|nr:transposase [Hyphomicrobiales bacterium]